MHYKVTVFVGAKAESEGWYKVESQNEVEINNGKEKIGIRIVDEKAIIEVTGDGSVLILRGDKTARLMNMNVGVVKVGDIVWLLNKEAENEYKNGERGVFSGAAVRIEFHNIEPKKKEEIFVNEKTIFREGNNKNVNLILGFIVLGLLITGTFFGYQKRTENEQKKKYEEIKSEVEKKLKEIEGVRTINIETALELTKNAESIANNAGKAEKKYLPELTELRKQINEIKKSLGGINVEYEIAYDSALIKEGNNIFKGMATRDGVVYLWSANLGQVNMVNPNLKSTEKIVGDERIKMWQGIFNNGEKWFGYDQNKIYEIKRNELIETEISGVKTVEEMTGWNGLIYVLDSGNQNIMKLNNGEANLWLKEGTTLSEEVVSMNIDSSIWVLGKSGKIYKYNRGIEENYKMSALTSLTSVKHLRTSDRVNFLAYVTDENTVVIYGKDGKILGKYNFGEIKINDIGIENQNKAVLVLAKNGKIYRIRIK